MNGVEIVLVVILVFVDIFFKLYCPFVIVIIGIIVIFRVCIAHDVTPACH